MNCKYVGGIVKTLALFLILVPAFAGRWDRYAIVLEDQPLAVQVSSAKQLSTARKTAAASKIAAAQASIKTAVAQRGLTVLGSIDTLANAVFILAAEDQIDALRAMPGVRYVQQMRPVKLNLDRAAELVNAPAAWQALGGVGNAGTGVKIAILDTGIDQSHPAFQDSALSPPSGYPKCAGADCNFTNGKVIAARSYVSQLVYFDANFTRPDDLTPRDRVGHGTAAAMVAAGKQVTGPAATIQGIAPKAYLGNYKIYGSPGVNDVAFDDVILKALEDAFSDGMDIASLSSGGPALWAPSDRGSTCGETGSNPCDLLTEAVSNAVKKGMEVVVSAGNDGDAGLKIPTMNSIGSPGTAPEALTVGATTNGHIYYSSVSMTNGPDNLKSLAALFGNGPKPTAALTAPLRDVSKLQDNGLACSGLTNGSLNGAVALIQRGDCTLEVKVNNAQRAGAIAVVLFQTNGNDFVYSPRTLDQTGIPAVMISNTAGQALKSYLSSTPDAPVTLDPKLAPRDAAADEVAYFSSQGPSIENAIKPEVMAVGTDLYLATQKFDPNGDMFDPSGFTAAQGTSFSAPMAAGAAALVKQQFRNYSPAQLKSAVVNTATATNLIDYDYNGGAIAARVTGVGAGKLNVGNAIKANVTADPPTVSFGAIRQMPQSRTLRITNGGTSAVQLSFAVTQRDTDSIGRVTVTPATLNLNAGASGTITVQLTGSGVPRAGSYEGAITVNGAAVPMRIPYLYLVSDNVAFSITPLLGPGFVGLVSQTVSPRLSAKFVDRYGLPVANVPVTFRAVTGGGRIDTATRTTDDLGIAEARVILGATLGEQSFSVTGNGLTYEFFGEAMTLPLIRSEGVVNAASGRAGAQAPGSYISIFGSSLSPVLRAATTASLPLALAGVSVGFDVAGGNSYPGRLHFVSPGQINVQIPWEVKGQTSVDMRVNIGDISSAKYTIQLTDAAPAFFEYGEAASGRTLVAALDQGFQLVSTGNAARRGQAVQLFMNALGPVDNTPQSGELTQSNPLARTIAIPTVTIGGMDAQVVFSGMTPQSVGLYQVNVVIPANAPTGLQPVNFTIGGVTARAGTIPVQ